MNLSKSANRLRFLHLLPCVLPIARALLLATVPAVMFSAPSPALALQGGEDPALLPVLVDKRFGSDGRHQLALFFSTAMASKFTESTGFYATYAYNFTDIFGAQLGGGFFGGSESAILERVRLEFPAMDGEPELGDLHQLQWTAAADFMIVPLYGKMSFASELDPGYDLYLFLGGGVVGLRRQEGLENPEIKSAVSVGFDFGAGLRFYFHRLVALRIELRNIFYPDPGSDVFEASDSENKGGLSFHLLFQGGIQLQFGGDE